MWRRTFPLVVLAACLVAGTSQAATASHSVPLTGADQIEVNVAIELHVLQGEQESLVVSADEKDMSNLRIRQEGDVLYLDNRDKEHLNFTFDRKVMATLTLKNLNALHLNTAGKVFIAPLRADRLELSISGAGTIEVVNLAASSVQLSIAGAGEIDASGNTNTVSIDVSGLGAASLTALSSKSGHVAISGGGSVKLAASDELDASISGFGEVRYKGSPRVTKTVSGIGSVSPIGS